MKLNKNDLRKILYDFNSLSCRLLQSDFNDYNGVLSKFITFITETDIINDFIVDCGECDQDMDKEFEQVQTHSAIFDLGETTKEEVRNVYSILSYIISHNVNVPCGIGISYSYARKYQDILKDFNDRVTMVLIRHIETYLTKVGIDMGVDDQIVYNITFRDGQVNIANDNANITASNSVNAVDTQQLLELINDVLKKVNESGLSEEDRETVNNSLELIEQEAKADKPRKSFIKTAVSALKTVKGAAEFGAAVVTLIDFLAPLL